MRNRSQKTAETLLLEPTKNAEKRKMPKRCFWNLLKTKKKGCFKQGKPLRNVRLGSLQATRPNSRKRCLGRAVQTMRNRSQKTAETLLWEPTNINKNKKSLQATRPNSRKRCLGRACEKAEPQQVLCPSHLRNRSQKNAKTLFWNPLKRKKR